MTRRSACLILAMIVGGCSLALRAQQRDTRPIPPPAAPAAPTGKGSIAGTVVADASGGPVAYAAVVLIGARTGALKVTSTDRQGVFSFSALPDDRFTIGVSKPPYLGAIAGARRPARPGSPVVVADGASVSGVMIRMTLGASISGTLLDGRGAPASGGTVAPQLRKMQNGERVLVSVPGSAVQTDDRGRYRIYGLPPGEYVVGAMTFHATVPGIPALTDAEVDAVLAGQRPKGSAPVIPVSSGIQSPVYYPGTIRPDDAVSIVLGPGEERQNVDIPWQSSTSTRISGVVSNADGSPAPQVTVQFTSSTMGVSARTGADGQFASPIGVAPGRYNLLARGTGPQAPFALQTVEATGTEISGLQLVLQPPLQIAGRIVATASARPPTLAGHRIQMTALTSILRPITPQVTPSTATGEFTISGLMTGQYVVTGAPFFGASTESVTWGLGSITADGHDVTDRAIDVRAGSLPKELVVTFTDQWQEVSGQLTNAQGAGVSDYTMLIFPTDESYWLYNSRRHATAQPASDGRYRLGGPGPAMLPAGEYYLAAVTDVSKDEQYDPAFLKSVIPSALKISLAAGQKMTQNVRVQ
jgi:hypothetical protein